MSQTFLKIEERKFQVYQFPDILHQNQSQLSEQIYVTLITQILEYSRTINTSYNTFYLFHQIFIEYMKRNQVIFTTSTFHLVGITCLFLAIKIEDDNHIHLYNFRALLTILHPLKEIIYMEKKILQTINYSICNQYTLFSYLMNEFDLSRYKKIVYIFAEMALIYPIFLKYKYSHLGQTIYYLAKHICEHDNILEEGDNIQENELYYFTLYECLVDFYNTFQIIKLTIKYNFYTKKIKKFNWNKILNKYQNCPKEKIE
jgi:hypothetical protein